MRNQVFQNYGHESEGLEFSQMEQEFSEFRDFDKALKYELGSI